jgi:hypothetical protein
MTRDERLAKKAAGVKAFVKQDSAPKPGQQGRIPLAVWSHKEFPEARS